MFTVYPTAVNSHNYACQVMFSPKFVLLTCCFSHIESNEFTYLLVLMLRAFKGKKVKVL